MTPEQTDIIKNVKKDTSAFIDSAIRDFGVWLHGCQSDDEFNEQYDNLIRTVSSILGDELERINKAGVPRTVRRTLLSDTKKKNKAFLVGLSKKRAMWAGIFHAEKKASDDLSETLLELGLDDI